LKRHQDRCASDNSTMVPSLVNKKLFFTAVL
jgi:hypothetical protein